MKNKNVKRIILSILLAPMIMLSLAGCWESDAENAVEDVGEQIEDTMDKAGDAVEDSAEKVEESVDNPE